MKKSPKELQINWDDNSVANFIEKYFEKDFIPLI